MRRVPKEERLQGAKDGVLGYFDQNNFSPCRLTAYTRNHWEQFGSTVLPYIQSVDSLFRTHMPERHANQLSVANTTPGYGGTLVFPKWNLGFNLSTGDVLLCNVHELHGNLPLIGEPGKYQRLSCVFYYREKLQDCVE